MAREDELARLLVSMLGLGLAYQLATAERALQLNPANANVVIAGVAVAVFYAGEPLLDRFLNEFEGVNWNLVALAVAALFASNLDYLNNYLDTSGRSH